MASQREYCSKNASKWSIERAGDRCRLHTAVGDMSNLEPGVLGSAPSSQVFPASTI